MFEVSQESILGPLLFNIFLCGLFDTMENIDIVSYADDNTPCTTGNSIQEVIKNYKKLEKPSFSGLVIKKKNEG